VYTQDLSNTAEPAKLKQLVSEFENGLDQPFFRTEIQMCDVYAEKSYCFNFIYGKLFKDKLSLFETLKQLNF